MGSHPLRGDTHPFVSSASRNGKRRNGGGSWPSRRAHSARGISLMLPWTRSSIAAPRARRPDAEWSMPVCVRYHVRAMALVPPLDLPPDEVRSLLEPLRNRISVAIYNCQNAFSIGAIIRVAHSFLVREIVIIGRAPWYEKASMGMQRYENIVELAGDEAFFEHVGGRPIWSVEKDHATTGLYDVTSYPDDV